MPLKNKDGSLYRLRAPNPIMKNQDLWGDKFVIHNMNWKKEIAKDLNDKLQVATVIKKKTFLEELTDTKPEIKEVKKEIKPEPPKKTISQEIPKDFIYCLPVIINKKEANFYGDQYQTIEYGKPFSFEGVIISKLDLTLSLWTTAEISEGSILFPKNNEKRWWKVQEKVEKTGGWILTSIPSDYQPYFDF